MAFSASRLESELSATFCEIKFVVVEEKYNSPSSACLHTIGGHTYIVSLDKDSHDWTILMVSATEILKATVEV